MYIVYVLRSTADQKLYIGFTKDLKQRIIEHNAGRVPSTETRRPLKIIFFECYANKDDALRREMYLKSSAGKKAIKFMLKTTLRESSTLP